MKYRDIIKQVKKEGWRLHHARGSHLIFHHTTRKGTVTIPGGGKLNREAKAGTLKSIYQQAGIKP